MISEYLVFNLSVLSSRGRRPIDLLRKFSNSGEVNNDTKTDWFAKEIL